MDTLRSDDLVALINAQRREHGFLMLTEMMALSAATGSTFFDPFSTLISVGVELGRGNMIYPNVTIEARGTASIRIGDSNRFLPGCLLLAEGGVLTIGDNNQFGGGGLQLIVPAAGADLIVGSHGRYMNGPDITGPCWLESGSQVLGAISAQNCRIEAGDSYQHPDAETRGGVLKGVGRARGLVVRQGEVINGHGSFRQEDVESQLAYHPKPR